METSRFKEVMSKRSTKRIILIVIFVLLIYMSIFTGIYDFNLIDLILDNGQARFVFMNSRLPRTLAIILSASGLSVAGLIMQSISRNKFMAPSTSGANDAALLGLVIATVFLGSLSTLQMTIFAFIFSFMAIMLFTSVVNNLKIKEAAYIPLLGMMFGALLAAITATIAHTFDIRTLVNSFSIGTFNRFDGFGLIYLILVPLILIVIYSHKFSIIGMGEDFAKNLGVSYNKVVFFGLVCVSMVTAASFVSIGPLPFIGLLIPNLVSTIYGDNIKKSLADLMIFGSSFVLLADVLTRVIFPYSEIPAGLSISVVGGVIFVIYILGGLNNGKSKRS